MSTMPPGLEFLDLTEAELQVLRPWAQLFDSMARMAPPPDGDRYSAEEFVAWLVLERRSRATDAVSAQRPPVRQQPQLRAVG